MSGAGRFGTNFVSPTALRRARDEFVHLLQRRTPEREWQALFAANPHVLSIGLPLQLLPSDIVPMGRLGRSEPDFLIHPGSQLSRRIHGIVELKTNYARITTHGRKLELVLSREAAIAERQLRTYDALYDSFAPTQRLLALDTLSHLFVIMGSSDELMNLSEELRPQLKEILPSGIRFLTFTELLRSYSTEVPTPVAMLRRAIPPAEEIVSLLTFAKETQVRLALHRIVSEAYTGFDLRGSGSREIDFRAWTEMLFARPPHVQTRFQPEEHPVLYATSDFQAALSEIQAYRPRGRIRAPDHHRYRHFVSNILAGSLRCPEISPSVNCSARMIIGPRICLRRRRWRPATMPSLTLVPRGAGTAMPS